MSFKFTTDKNGFVIFETKKENITTGIRIKTTNNILIDVPLENIEIMRDMWKDGFENGCVTSWSSNEYIYFLFFADDTITYPDENHYSIEVTMPQHADDNVGTFIASHKIAIDTMESIFKSLDKDKDNQDENENDMPEKGIKKMTDIELAYDYSFEDVSGFMRPCEGCGGIGTMTNELGYTVHCGICEGIGIYENDENENDMPEKMSAAEFLKQEIKYFDIAFSNVYESGLRGENAVAELAIVQEGLCNAPLTLKLNHGGTHNIASYSFSSNDWQETQRYTNLITKVIGIAVKWEAMHAKEENRNV